ncbi:MAG: cobyrinate a,c-diamide synthase [Gloeomargarita sp. SKYBB_i_bin120]|nr:cobyrinate a,c-diamide synthase [Gloeomargarita sp. SKYG98]MCS7291411.1 cobyrinate a,c-diamide synthase [Gloeomargarita sp. SKYB120]MDW8176971.1 cobyrinate a,c-diamide synthase [Gloeomargarita sp. SKYBB_i_bin120]
MGLILAGERSGVGKTTVALAILAALTAWGEPVQSFKVGPDYLDPLWHRWLTRRPCPNLDTVLTSPDYLQRCYAYYTADVAYALVEGVMGLFDGPSSTAEIAKLLDLPVVLVVDCQRLAGSVAALVQGYATWDPKLPIAGVVLNRVASDRHSELLRQALAPVGIPVVGECRRTDALHRPERHLGLVTPLEIADFATWRDALAHVGQHCFDWQVLRPLLRVSGESPALPPWPTLHCAKSVTLAVAYDEAFCFYYDDLFALLEVAGVALHFWSPLRDGPLPHTIHGLLLGGGYPELHAEPLSQRSDLWRDLRQRIAHGLPVYAECGGLMVLGEALIDQAGQAWPMARVLPLTTAMTGRLTLGYRCVQATQDTCFVRQGQTLTGHEFHYSQVVGGEPQPYYGHATLHASYLHCHWGGCAQQVQQFLDCVQQYTPQVVEGLTGA